MSEEQGLAVGWYTSESGQRRYWTGNAWLTPAPEGQPPLLRDAKPRSRRRLAVLVGAAVAVLLAVGGIGLAVKSSTDQAAATRAAAAQKHRAELAAEKAADERAAADAQAAADETEREGRSDLISALEGSVKKTAKKDVTLGVLDGPILDVSCTPLGGGSTDDLTQKTATLQCFAANKKNDDGTQNGYNFSATMNWDSGEYTWRLGS